MNPPPPTTFARSLLLCPLLLCLSACCSETTTLVEITEPLHVKIVLHETETMAFGGGRLGCAPSTVQRAKVDLHVETQKVRLNCAGNIDTMRVEIGPNQKRIAWSVAEEPWRLVYIRPNQLVRGGDGRQLPHGEIDWTQAEDWADARISLCLEGSSYCRMVFEEATQEGTSTLEQRLLALITMPPSQNVWIEAYNKLDPSEQARLHEKMRRLLSKSMEPDALRRVVNLLELSPEELEVALEASHSLVVDGSNADQGKTWSKIVTLATKAKLPQASHTACSRWRDLVKKDNNNPVAATGLLSMLVQNKDCPATRKFSVPQPPPCDTILRCGEGPLSKQPLCSGDQLRQRAAALLDQSLDQVSKVKTLWALRKGLSPAAQHANARRLYLYEDPPANIVCNETHKAMSPCSHPPDRLAEAACLTKGNSGRDQNATFLIDDERKRLHNIKALHNSVLDSLTVSHNTTCGLTKQGDAQCWEFNKEALGDKENGATKIRTSTAPAVYERTRLLAWPEVQGLMEKVWAYRGHVVLTKEGTLWIKPTEGAPQQLATLVRDVAMTTNATCIIQGPEQHLLCNTHYSNPYKPLAPLQSASFKRVAHAGSLLCAQTDKGKLWCWTDKYKSSDNIPQLWGEASPEATFSMWSQGACLREVDGATQCRFLDETNKTWSTQAPAKTTSIYPDKNGILWQTEDAWFFQPWDTKQLQSLDVPETPLLLTPLVDHYGSASIRVALFQGGKLQWWSY